MTSSRNGLIWISTNGCGITLYDHKTKETRHIRHETGKPSLVSSNYILDMFLDRDDNIWIADEFNGIACLTIPRKQFETIILDANQVNMHGNQVRIMQFAKDSTMLIANSNGDIYKCENLHDIPESPFKTGFNVHTICSDKDGKLWLGTRQNGLLVEDNTYVHDKNDITSLSSNNIWYLFQDKSGRMWIATENASLDLAEMQPDGSYVFRHFLGNDIGAKVIMQDSNGYIWIGAKTGLYSFNPEEILHDPSAYKRHLNENDTKYSDVCAVFEDSKNRLWVGTIGNGIFYMDISGTNDSGFKHLTTGNGLISNEVQSIGKDDNGLIWIATKKGITCFQRENNSYRYLYDYYDLQHNYFSENCMMKLRDGKLAFGTNAGIVVYDPRRINRAYSHSKVTITDILINGISVNMMDDSPIKTSPDNLEVIRLAHDRNSLIIRFSNFNYTNNDSTRYTYYLENYDKGWNDVSVYSFATYKNLPPGKYILHYY